MRNGLFSRSSISRKPAVIICDPLTDLELYSTLSSREKICRYIGSNNKFILFPGVFSIYIVDKN